jgi:hypothetical protein
MHGSEHMFGAVEWMDGWMMSSIDSWRRASVCILAHKLRYLLHYTRILVSGCYLVRLVCCVIWNDFLGDERASFSR